MEFLFYSFLSLLAGIFAKLDDSCNEHGLKLFKYDYYLFAILWGVLVGFLISFDKAIFVTFISLMFYGIYRLKFDFRSHAIALIILLIFGLNCNYSHVYIDLIIVTILYLIFDYLKRNSKYGYTKKLFKYNFHFLIIPIAYSIIENNIYGIVIIFTIIGKVLVNYKLKK